MTSAHSSTQSDTMHQPVAELFTYWRESDGHFLGYLNAYPDHWTQGEDLEDLKAHLLDLYHEFSKQDLPGIRMVGELVVA
jgi:predicted RNase H-like HicB family nuclease